MKKNIVLIWSIFLLCQGCANSQERQIPAGLPDELKTAYPLIQKADNLRSFVMSRKGELVYEEYFQSFPSDSLEHVRSVTKSVMSTLIGIAIDQRLIVSVQDPITKYLGDEAKGKENITIWHILTMSSGLQWNEGANAEGYSAWARSPHQLKNALQRDIVVEPGTVWNYNSGATHILSAILTNASGMSTYEFAERYLFGPMGIENFRWQKFSDGYYNGGAGLEVKPRDMVKIGEMMLNKGMYKGKRIVSEAFVTEATTHQLTRAKNLGKGAGYGYLWYLAEEQGQHVIAAVGYAGQIIAIFQEHDAVVAITHYWRVSGSKAAAQDQHAGNVILEKVLLAMMDQ